MMYKDNEKGRSMLEMMGYMAAVMSLIAGISKMIVGAYGDYKMGEGVRQVSELSDVISKFVVVEGNADIIDKICNPNSSECEAASEAKKYLPESYRVVNGDILHTFGGKVEITKDDDNRSFFILFHGLNEEQCIELAMKDWQINRVSDLYSMSIDLDQYLWGIYVENCDETDEDSEFENSNCLPAKHSKVSESCKLADEEADEEDGITITWKFNM